MKKIENSHQKIRKLTMIALFTALAYVVMIFIHFPISFLTLDMKDAIITLCGLYFGPGAVLFGSVAVPLLEMVTVSTTGIYGFVMNAAGTLAFAFAVGIVYRYKKSFSGAILGLICGIVSMTAAMLLLNLFITPFYFGITAKDVVAMIPTLLLPFNLVKSVLNAGIVLLLYKPLSGLLQKTGMMEAHEQSFQFGKRNLAVTIVALALIILSVTVIFLVLGGKLQWGIQ